MASEDVLDQEDTYRGDERYQRRLHGLDKEEGAFDDED